MKYQNLGRELRLIRRNSLKLRKTTKRECLGLEECKYNAFLSIPIVHIGTDSEHVAEDGDDYVKNEVKHLQNADAQIPSTPKTGQIRISVPVLNTYFVLSDVEIVFNKYSY